MPIPVFLGSLDFPRVAYLLTTSFTAAWIVGLVLLEELHSHEVDPLGLQEPFGSRPDLSDSE